MNNGDYKRLNLLVVEDSRSARMKIISSLEALDVDIFEADDGVPAFNMLQDEKQHIDLVLTDLNMKKMDGDELCSKIRNELGLKDIPIIVLSSSIDKETTVNLFKMGATDYLYKPFIPEELIARINSHLEQIKLKKVLQYQIQQLNELNQMKDDVIEVCSHDFRSPLQVILGNTELIMLDNLSENHRSMLANIKTSGGHLLEIINQIMEIGKAGQKKQQNKMAVLDIVPVLVSCRQSFDNIALKKNIWLKFEPEPESTELLGDLNALTRIFNNLLSNAIKFTPAGGTVTISLEKTDNKKISVLIKDTGIGLTKEELPYIFEKYSSVSRKGTNGEDNTGLGLYITKDLIENHGGRIEVDSTLNEGTCFQITLPMYISGL